MGEGAAFGRRRGAGEARGIGRHKVGVCLDFNLFAYYYIVYIYRIAGGKSFAERLAPVPKKAISQSGAGRSGGGKRSVNAMTAIKNGIKCTLRTPWKTILFSMVLILLSALLTVSLCVFTAVRRYLSDCGDYYHTIANLEYIGSDYPISTVYDADLVKAVSEHKKELDALIDSDEAISFEPESNTVALVDGFHRWDYYVLDPSRAVLRLRYIMYDDRIDVFLMELEETYYSTKDYGKTLLYVRTGVMPVDGGETPETDRSYYVSGRFFKGQTANPWFFAEEASFYEDGETITLPAFTPADADEALIDEYLRFAEIAQLKNDSCRVFYSADLDDYPPFQQQMISLAKGRLFTAEEYAEKAHVCVVSSRIAGAFGLGLGDTINLTVLTADEALYEPGKWKTLDEGGFEIVGVYEDSEEFPYRIFLPDAEAANAGIRPVTGYRLGHFRLRNEGAVDFEAKAQPLQEYGFRLTVYDQGYASATEPMRELMFISIVFLAVCLLLALVAHALQSHLFVSRQKETAQTMRALGSGTKHVILYFISAALLLSIVSAVIGCVIGKLLESRVMEALRQFATQYADKDLRFSGSRLSLSRTLAFEPSIGINVYLLSAALLIIGSVLFTAVFAMRSLRDEKTKKKKRSDALQALPKREAKNTKLSGALKYALLSLRRGVVRTVAVILLCMIAAIFFGRLTASLGGYRDQLDSYRANAVITGFATDYKGRLIDGLIIRNSAVKNILSTGLISEHTVTDTVAYCELVGIPITADGEEREVRQVNIPSSGSFAIDTLIDRLHSENRWVAASSINGSPLFHYSKVKDVTWLDGYSDEDFLGRKAICVLPQTMMAEEGIELGDTIRLLFADTLYFAFQLIGIVDVKVVGTYAAETSATYIFSPINYHPSVHAMEVENGYSSESIATRTYDSFLFTLGDASRLDELRSALADSGFTYVHSGNRSYPHVIIEDEIYLNTTHSMERQIQYVSVLYDALYVIAGVIGFVLAWLLALSRRKEIAVMRAMGTQPLRILVNFFFEQALLSTVGILIGGAVSYLLGCPLSKTFIILCAAFWAVWNLSTLLCLIAGLLKPSYASLTEPE